MKERRVVITGMGSVSCGGNSVDALWDTLIHGRSGIAPLTLFDVSGMPVRFGGEVRDLELQNVNKKEERRFARYTRFAVAAAHEAMTQAGLGPHDPALDPYRCGVLAASGSGGLEVLEKNIIACANRGASGVSAFYIPTFISNNASGILGIRYGFKGCNFSAASACASGAHGLGEAFWMIKRGDADVMLAGGSEACITPSLLSGFAALTALSTRNDDPQKASRPFDKNRDGFVFSEGAGLLVLEELEHARKRGAEILAEFAGYGATCDAYHITAPDPAGDGIARAMKTAMCHGGCAPEEVGHIAAHGTATKANDVSECRAIRSVFGTHADHIAVNSIKSMIGHTIGASGPIGAISAIQTLRTGIVPPTINCTDQDPECDLDVTALDAKQVNTEYAIVNSLGFGGHNTALLFRRWKE